MSSLCPIVIAGATGLVGRHLLNLALKNDKVGRVYTLSRQELKISHANVVQMVSPTLEIDSEKVKDTPPKIGFIALGTTLKKAGTKEALKAIDVALVVAVAKAMKLAGVRRICVVSCLGASASSLSHYLKCKGIMEQEIERMGFELVTFMQPGPLSGERETTRNDEVLLQSIMNILNPILKWKLMNYKPIDGELVAQSMLDVSLSIGHQKNGVRRITSKEMFALQQTKEK